MFLKKEINQIVKEWISIINSMVYKEVERNHTIHRCCFVPVSLKLLYEELKEDTRCFLFFHNIEYITQFDDNIIEFEKNKDITPLLRILKTLKDLRELYGDIHSNQVFIVHGHSELLVAQTEAFLQKLGFEPIILRNQANRGLTNIEMLENNSDVAFAIVLYSVCDQDGLNDANIPFKSQALHNVIFEHGYIIAKIGRNKVCALVEEGVECPSDLSGLVYIPIDKNGAWKRRVAYEMQVAGLDVDLNGVMI